jgi:cytochrome c-type biogenesis protein CcmH
MVFWIAVAVLSAAVTFAVTRPLLKEHVDADDVREADLAIYKDQLAEIDTDAARGLISESEAEAARAEVGRRVLRRADAGKTIPEVNVAEVQWPKRVHLIATMVIPLASLGLYLVYGMPGLPGAPLHDRLAGPIDTSRTEDLIARVEARLRSHPEDGKGWEVIAPVYMSLGRFSDAAAAYASANKILGESPKRLLGFAEARIRAENGVISGDARQALRAVVAADPKNVEARIWLALAKEEDGEKSAAAADLRGLISEAPDGAPYKSALEQRLAEMEHPEAASGPGATAARAPSQSEIATAAQMTPEQRQAMITQMVERLAERLKTNAKDKEGWQRLIRAYQVLGRKDDAIKAVASAKAGLAGDDQAVREIEAFAKSLGIGG